jgi:hypothetical protein
MINFQGFSHLLSNKPVLNYHFFPFLFENFSIRKKGDDKDLTQEQDICRHVGEEFLYPVVYLL